MGFFKSLGKLAGGLVKKVGGLAKSVVKTAGRTAGSLLKSPVVSLGATVLGGPAGALITKIGGKVGSSVFKIAERVSEVGNAVAQVGAAAQEFMRPVGGPDVEGVAVGGMGISPSEVGRVRGVRSKVVIYRFSGKGRSK